MSDDQQDFLQHILRPVLTHLNWSRPDLETLILGAAIAGKKTLLHYEGTDSACGCGIFDITPNVHRGVWDHYLAFQPDLASKVRGLASQHRFLVYPDLELMTNLSYATAIAAALIYWTNRWPEHTDAESFTCCWLAALQVQNTSHEPELICAYRELLAESLQLA